MRDVTFVVFDGVQSLDLTGPLEVLHTATLLLDGDDGYRTRIVGPAPMGAESPSNRRPRAATATSSSGLVVGLDGIIGDPAPSSPRTSVAAAGPAGMQRQSSEERSGGATLVVAGGLGTDSAAADPELVAGIDRLAESADRVTSVCSGALLLAATGRLDGKRATTHWSRCAELAERHPEVEVDPDAIYVRDGDVWTSAGVTAGMDLALALVSDDHGPDIAHAVAGWLVMFVQRAGGQSQFSPQLTPVSRSEPLRDLQRWIAENLAAELSVATLARRAAMSERHLTRLFTSELGTTPAAYVESLRIDAARRLLETTQLTVAEVANRVGFRSDAVLHRAFGRTVRTTPGTYRQHFTSHTPSRS